MLGKITLEAINKEVESAFPYVEMPPSSELAFHPADCEECEYLRMDLEPYRGKEVPGEVIRMVHQELSVFSAKGWRWIMPHYLRFCLTPEGPDSQDETEFLIYNLGPDTEFEPDTEVRLSLINDAQLVCLIHFLEWCLNQEYWAEYCPGNINDAIRFLLRIKGKRCQEQPITN